MRKLMLSLAGFRSAFGVMSAYRDVAAVVMGPMGVPGRDSLRGVPGHDNEGFDDDEFDILMWQKLNHFRFLVLATIARDVLVASKYAFSTGGWVLDGYRSSLTPKVVQALICAQDRLHGLAHGDPDLIKDDLDEPNKLDFYLANIALETIVEFESD
ncbi:Uncharacterized protein TCM_012838 [Theobroma cacao]|uniref:HAT C-terminal dimerisation domain-containing protein n=1 Tax=Theobroma cacao TaxID=3641 RepID=A0A061FUY3_THECC|nr:Uncharacterized protein TCM_012838 [Theobroma cacao]